MSLSDSGVIQYICLIVEEWEATGKDGILKPQQVERLKPWPCETNEEANISAVHSSILM
jgi:hypothetical protein